MDLWKVSEAEFRNYVRDTLFDQIDPEVPLVRDSVQEEVRVGAFRIDLLALNADGGITLVEFKINMANDTLAQLLLYPRAVATVLKDDGCPTPPEIRMVLVTPFLDKGVVDLLGSITMPTPVVIRLCVQDGKGAKFKLVGPSMGPSDQGQYRDQATRDPEKCQIRWKDGVYVKGDRIGGFAPDTSVGSTNLGGPRTRDWSSRA